MGIFLIILFLLYVVCGLRFMVRALEPKNLAFETAQVLRAFRPSLILMEYEDAQALVISQAKKSAKVPFLNLFGYNKLAVAVIEAHRPTVMKWQLRF